MTYDCGKQKDSLTARLNKRVTIKQLSTTQDSYGQPIEGLVDVTTVWAGIEPLQGQEYFAAMRENADVTTRIRIRYRTDIDRTMFVVYGDQTWEIMYVIHPKLAKRELQLMCKERQ